VSLGLVVPPCLDVLLESDEDRVRERLMILPPRHSVYRLDGYVLDTRVAKLFSAAPLIAPMARESLRCEVEGGSLHDLLEDIPELLVLCLLERLRRLNLELELLSVLIDGKVLAAVEDALEFPLLHARTSRAVSIAPCYPWQTLLALLELVLEENRELHLCVF